MLDEAIANALVNDEKLASWFLGQTKFAQEAAKCVLVRADNPWSKVNLSHSPAEDATLVELSKECETDVLAIFETKDGRRLALHIENKLANGSFTPLQPELYRERLTQWRMKPKLGMYTEATSVLVAPLAFYQRNEPAAKIFDSYVSHEDLSVHIEPFGQGGSSAAQPFVPADSAKAILLLRR
jgi:hypothetical protein